MFACAPAFPRRQPRSDDSRQPGVTKDEGQGTRDEGRGTKDEGRGTKDEGRGTKDEGTGDDATGTGAQMSAMSCHCAAGERLGAGRGSWAWEDDVARGAKTERCETHRGAEGAMGKAIARRVSHDKTLL